MNQFGKIVPTECDKNKGYYLYNGECKNEEIVGYFKDYQTGWFIKCDCNCKECKQGPWNCASCAFGMVINDWGWCVPNV